MLYVERNLIFVWQKHVYLNKTMQNLNTYSVDKKEIFLLTLKIPKSLQCLDGKDAVEPQFLFSQFSCQSAMI